MAKLLSNVEESDDEYADGPPDQGATMTAIEATMQDTAPRPPHRELAESDYQNVTFDQSIQGLHLYYRRFRAVEAAYEAISGTLSGEREPPIIPFPTGKVDEDGRPLVVEIDILATLPQDVSDDERMAALQRMLGPWHNHLVKEYSRWLKSIQKCTQQAISLLDAPKQPKRQARRAPAVPPIPEE